jgi:hypothetical protein
MIPLAHCKPVTLVAHAMWNNHRSPKLQDVIAAAKPNLGDAESHELEKVLTEYRDIFAMDTDDYRRI